MFVIHPLREKEKKAISGGVCTCKEVSALSFG